MPQTLHAPHLTFHIPKLSPTTITAIEFVVCCAIVMVLAVGLSIKFPLGPNNGWDDGTYLAQLEH